MTKKRKAPTPPYRVRYPDGSELAAWTMKQAATLAGMYPGGRALPAGEEVTRG